MSESARKSLLARLRRGGARPAPDPAAIAAELESLGAPPAPPLPGADPIEAFVINLLRNQGSAEGAADRGEAVRAVAGFLYRQYRSQKLAVGNDPRLGALPWRDAGLLPRFEPAADGELAALSYARLAVAETGAVVTYTGRANPARNNLLPESHLVLVDAADVVATMEQAWDRIGRDMLREGRPRGVNFIAGPSSTADIELRLVRGAHGPRQWHVILLGEGAPALVESARRAAGTAGPA